MVTVPSDICAVLHRMAQHSTAQHRHAIYCLHFHFSASNISLSFYIYNPLNFPLNKNFDQLYMYKLFAHNNFPQKP